MLADPSAELLKQLTRIADEMNRSGPSPWIDWFKTVASFVTGLVTAYASVVLQGWSSDHKEQNKMRRIVYCELADSFLFLHHAVDAATHCPTHAPAATLSVLQNLFNFDGESYMKENRATFYQLPEGPILALLYTRFHTIRVGGTYQIPVLKGDLGFFSDSFNSSTALRKHLKRFVRKDKFSAIEEAVPLYKWRIDIEDMIASGMIEVVESEPEPAAGPRPGGMGS
ncbi:MAG: hypothetical protein ABR987_21705 [Terracidiphilus sp.]|jgi:hypothetical protein